MKELWRYLPPMKHYQVTKSIVFAASFAMASAGFSQTTGSEWGFNNIPDNSQVNQMSGPRFGVSYISEGTTAQVLNRVHQMDTATFRTSDLPATFTTQYGWQWETRFADTGGPVVGLVEWVAFVAGMEKGMFLPSFSSLVGVRGESGFEFATGPNLSPSGLGFVFALGYNYTKGDLNLPINIALVPDKVGPTNSPLDDIIDTDPSWPANKLSKTGYRITVSVGFNLRAASN